MNLISKNILLFSLAVRKSTTCSILLKNKDKVAKCIVLQTNLISVVHVCFEILSNEVYKLFLSFFMFDLLCSSQERSI